MSAQGPGFLEPHYGLYVVDGRVKSTDVRRRLGLNPQAFREVLAVIGEMPLPQFGNARVPTWVPLEVAAQLIDEKDEWHDDTE
jgi:hypothetical protein